MQEYVAAQPNRSSPLPQRMQFVMIGSEPPKAQMPPSRDGVRSSTRIVQFVIVGDEATRSI